jgi:hypothetical protein
MNYPERIFIQTLSDDSGYIYTKDYEHENGGCYYSSKDNPSPIDSVCISLYPDGHLTYLWNGIEKEYNHKWFKINEKEN